LTVARSQISVEVSVQKNMSTVGKMSPRCSVPWWQILICVLLAGLFLYNPFLSAARSSDALTVCHPASHRATVGASELEQFTPSGDTAMASLPDTKDARELLPRPAAADCPQSRYAEFAELAVTPHPGFSSSLWFRPPPTV
jgi:hypothetical protein